MAHAETVKKIPTEVAGLSILVLASAVALFLNSEEALAHVSEHVGAGGTLDVLPTPDVAIPESVKNTSLVPIQAGIETLDLNTNTKITIPEPRLTAETPKEPLDTHAPILTETQAKIMKDLGISHDVLRDHVRGTSIVNDNGTQIAEIKTYRELGYDQDGYVVSTVDNKKAFATVAKLKEIGIDLEGKNIAWADHTSDNGRKDIITNACGKVVANYEMRQHNELIMVQYASCSTEPVVAVPEVPEQVIEPPKVVVKPEPVVPPAEVVVAEPPVEIDTTCFEHIWTARDGVIYHIETFDDINGSTDMDSASEAKTLKAYHGEREVSEALDAYFKEHPDKQPPFIKKHGDTYYDLRRLNRS